MKEKIEFQSVVAETLLIPLYMRAKESRRRDAVLHDPEAERLVARIAYDYGKFDKAWMSALGCVVRSRYYDQRVESFIRLNARPVVVNVGCGLDTRFQRIAERRNAVFYELDLPEVMAIREKLLPAPAGDNYLAGSLLDTEWLEGLRTRHPDGHFIFVFEGVLMYFHEEQVRTVLRNICFPLELAGVKASEAKARARELLRMVGLPDKENAYPAQLSGGQQQRVAIARALATNPKVLLCDEATSALDPKTTHDILSLIRDINQRLGITVIIITHQMSVVQEICDRVAILENGEVVEEGTVVSVFSNPKAAATRRLVFPDSAEDELDLPHDEHRLRVIFNGAPAANTPLIARMAMDKRIAANILYASTRSVGDKIYGHMLLGIPGGDEETRTAMEYLRAAENVVVEEA